MSTASSSIVLALGALLACGAAMAQTLTVSDPWVRATVPQQPATGAFMRLSAPKGAKLVEARSPAAATVEIHEMKMDGGTMQMRPVDAVDLPAGKTVELKPGGYHVMLMGLKKQLNEGDSVPLTLVVQGADGKRETVELKAPVRALNAPAQKH
jgi:periplasmic copper chaperone A